MNIYWRCFPARLIAGNRFGMIIQADKSSGIKENSDPLLDLVIASEVKGINPKSFLELAESARLLSEASLKPVKPCIDPTISEGFSITSIAMAASVKSTLVRKQYFIESSDNDVCGSKCRYVCLLYQWNSNPTFSIIWQKVFIIIVSLKNLEYFLITYSQKETGLVIYIVWCFQGLFF